MTKTVRDSKTPPKSAPASNAAPAAKKSAPSRAPGAQFTRQEALQFHSQGRPGKFEVTPTKPMATQRDLSLAYSPGVAVPVEAIAENPSLAYDYTTKGNLVAVISNGTAILGLGNLGALASKPVMEGKAVLFKRFADIDSIDLEIDTEDPEKFINAVRYLGPSFGGINLEDIKSPECFVIESRLRELMNIPVFHDDQHGTAIIVAAGLINALELTGRDWGDVKLVCNGAGAAALACLDLLVKIGLKRENIFVNDIVGVLYDGRNELMDEYKVKYARKTKARQLAEVIEGADVFLGLSAAGALPKECVAKMAPKPIIFAMANPVPEIMPEEAHEVREDAIVATGRSDYPNQVNNVLGFPYIFRGALDVEATTINDAMKIAAAEAIAALAREDVPDKVAAAYQGRRLRYGPDYIIPAPFDPRLISAIPPAVAQAAMDSGVARRPIGALEADKMRLSARLDPAAGFLNRVFEAVRANPKRVVFAEGEEELVVRAANAFYNAQFGFPVLIGRENLVKEACMSAGVSNREAFEIHNARLSERNAEYAEFLYSRLQRKGYLLRDCQRMVNTDRNIFGACMVALGHADAMVTGVTRNWSTIYADIRHVLDPKPGRRVIGVSLILSKGRAVLVADTSVHDMPNAGELADIAVEAAAVAEKLGLTPRVAMLAYSTFGHPKGERSDQVREAVGILDGRGVDFEYDGEMGADVALNKRAMALYPFCRLSDTANVLIMPAFHSASISTKMLQELGGGTVIGPLLFGLAKPVQIAQLGAADSDLVNMAALAAFNV
ncbi:MAG: NADP-dependent malic enzyme [Hyphomicrobiales bacterium]|nr:NADP-dependent malic enzyme [Hyphomicrobiales bacterium]